MAIDGISELETFLASSRCKEPRDTRTKLFTLVRNIPYQTRAIKSINDPVLGIKIILQHKEGSCTPKHYLLGKAFELLGYKVNYCCFPFLWSSTSLSFPHHIAQLAQHCTTDNHYALKVLLNGSWILVDATWDPALASIGAHINEWDGQSDTICAVDALEEVCLANAKQHAIYRDRHIKQLSSKHRQARTDFYTALDLWLRELHLAYAKKNFSKH
jgi:hypothetical protein